MTAETVPTDLGRDTDVAEVTELAVAFGRRVRELRRTRGLTQAELAARLSRWGLPCHQSTIMKIEHGQRPVSVHELAAWAAELGVTKRELIEEPGPVQQAVDRVRTAEHEVCRIQMELADLAAQQMDLEEQLRFATKRHRALLKRLRQTPGWDNTDHDREEGDTDDRVR